MKKEVTRYIPLLNGTAFMGMGSNTGCNAGKEYPYVLWEDYKALQEELEALTEDGGMLCGL